MDNQLIAAAITKAIAYTEHGGNPSIDNPAQGKSGEMKSIYQYTPATWKHVSQQVYGKEMPMTADTETYATLHRVKGWLDKGYRPAQIFSMWNAGEGEPDAYTGKFGNNTGSHRAGDSSSGVNSYGVRYDVRGYTKKGLEYSKKFYDELSKAKTPANGGSSLPQTAQQSSISPSYTQPQNATLPQSNSTPIQTRTTQSS